MYKDRLFENESEYLNFIARTGLPSDAGNVYQVIQTSKAFYSDFRANKQFQYSDGSWAVYPDSGNGLGIQAAINACKGGRNDYILVGTGAYNLTVALTLAGKSSVHLIAVNGGSGMSTVLNQTGDFPAVQIEMYDEAAGFDIQNHAGYPAIYGPTTAGGVIIRDNTFAVSNAAGPIHIVDLTTGLAGNRATVKDNRFYTWGGALTLASCIGIGTSTGCDVLRNRISLHSGTITAGISNLSAQGITADNIVSSCGGGSTFTKAIVIVSTGCAIGNRCAVGTTLTLSGGTPDVSYVDNMDGSTGAIGGQITNLEA